MRDALRTAFWFASLGLSFGFAGCGDGSSEESALQTSTTEAAAYHPELGLSIPPHTWDAMGLVSEEVVLAQFVNRWRCRVRVVGAGKDGGVVVRAVVPADRIEGRSSRYAVTWDGMETPVPAALVERHSGLVSVIGGEELLFEVLDPAPDWVPTTALRGTLEAASVSSRESCALPEEALVRAAFGNYIYLHEQGGKARRVAVTVGARNGRLAEIVEGVAPGDRVICEGAERLWILELAMVGGMGQLPEMQGEAPL